FHGRDWMGGRRVDERIGASLARARQSRRSDDSRTDFLAHEGATRSAPRAAVAPIASSSKTCTVPSERERETEIEDVDRARDGAEVHGPVRPVLEVSVGTDGTLDSAAWIASRAGKPNQPGVARVIVVHACEEDVAVGQHDVERMGTEGE